MNIADEKLWWERTIPKLNMPERERLAALLAACEQMQQQQHGMADALLKAERALASASVWGGRWKRAAKAEREQVFRNKTLLSLCAPPVDELRHRLEVAAHEWSLVKQDDSPLPGMYRRRSDGLLEGEPAEL